MTDLEFKSLAAETELAMIHARNLLSAFFKEYQKRNNDCRTAIEIGYCIDGMANTQHYHVRPYK